MEIIRTIKQELPVDFKVAESTTLDISPVMLLLCSLVPVMSTMVQQEDRYESYMCSLRLIESLPDNLLLNALQRLASMTTFQNASALFVDRIRIELHNAFQTSKSGKFVNKLVYIIDSLCFAHFVFFFIYKYV